MGRSVRSAGSVTIAPEDDFLSADISELVPLRRNGDAAERRALLGPPPSQTGCCASPVVLLSAGSPGAVESCLRSPGLYAISGRPAGRVRAVSVRAGVRHHRAHGRRPVSVRHEGFSCRGERHDLIPQERVVHGARHAHVRADAVGRGCPQRLCCRRGWARVSRQGRLDAGGALPAPWSRVSTTGCGCAGSGIPVGRSEAPSRRGCFGDAS